jgi:hypothetical protein
MRKNILLFAVVFSLLLQACAAAATPDAMMPEPLDVMQTEMPASTPEDKMDMPAETMSPGDPAGTPEAMMEAKTTESSDAMMDMMEMPAWLGAELTDIHTGEAFVLADYKGKVILVETMAVWCSSCLKQQEQVKALHALLGERDDLISVGLDIDPNEDGEDLKAFTEKNGFDWIYASAPAEIAREIGNLYGAQFLNPPSTPMLVIDRKGEAYPLPFGIKSAEDLRKMLEPFLAEGM